MRDAVHADARSASDSLWWGNDTACTTRAWPARTGAGRVVYPAGDPTARELATRLVATGTGNTAAGVAPAAFAAALAAGGDAAYVVPLPLERPATCAGLPRRPQGAVVVPLVITRAHAIYRAGAVRLSVDADGGARIVTAGPQ